MNNKILLGLLVLVIGAAAGWILLGSKGNGLMVKPPNGQSSSAGPSVPGGTATVQLTDNGFVPAIITVTQGTSVTFTNASSGQMWIASDPHPTHTLLSGFDELVAVGNGGSYSYTFTKIGTWTYHNHMNPAVKGTVVVANKI